MDLTDIEEEAATLHDKQAQLDVLEEELTQIITDLRVLPKQADREAAFAKLTGQKAATQDKVDRLEARKDEIAEEKAGLEEEIEALESRLIEQFASNELTIPLAAEPERTDDFWVFGFREDRAFPRSIGFLGDTLGLGSPLAIEGVLIGPEGVRVPIERDSDVSEAMEKVVAAFDQARNTLQMKLPKEEAW